jgi:UMF1 family MFS transporter
MIPPWISKQVFSWSLYDFADTAFSALFITFFFPILIKVHLGGTEFQIGLAMGLSVLAAALLVPLIGAISDATGKRMPVLIVAALLTALLCVLTGYSPLSTALVLGFLANITHLISKDVYDAKMIAIVPRALLGSLSGLGVAVGYFGTITSLAIAYPLFLYLGWESIASIRAAFWEASIFYILFSLPLFLFVPDIPRPTVSFPTAFKTALREIKHTLSSLPQSPVFGRFLAASFFYNNAMNTVIVFLSLYGIQEIGLSIQQFFPVFSIMALSAAAGSYLFGKLSDAFGPIKMIRLSLYIWIAITFYLLIITTYASFLIAGILGGAVLGAIWTLNRHMIAAISPEHKIAEWFGFEGLTEKFSGVLGPVIFGYLATAYGYTPALISMIVFFLIGLILIKSITHES